MYIDIMTLYINKYVALIKAFRKYIHNNNKIVCIVCKVYKHILNTKRKEIKKNVQQRSRGGVDIKIHNRFMYEVLFVTPQPPPLEPVHEAWHYRNG